MSACCFWFFFHGFFFSCFRFLRSFRSSRSVARCARLWRCSPGAAHRSRLPPSVSGPPGARCGSLHCRCRSWAGSARCASAAAAGGFGRFWRCAAVALRSPAGRCGSGGSSGSGSSPAFFGSCGLVGLVRFWGLRPPFFVAIFPLPATRSQDFQAMLSVSPLARNVSPNGARLNPRRIVPWGPTRCEC